VAIEMLSVQNLVRLSNVSWLEVFAVFVILEVIGWRTLKMRHDSTSSSNFSKLTSYWEEWLYLTNTINRMGVV